MCHLEKNKTKKTEIFFIMKRDFNMRIVKFLTAELRVHLVPRPHFYFLYNEN